MKAGNDAHDAFWNDCRIFGRYCFCQHVETNFSARVSDYFQQRVWNRFGQCVLKRFISFERGVRIRSKPFSTSVWNGSERWMAFWGICAMAFGTCPNAGRRSESFGQWCLKRFQTLQHVLKRFKTFDGGKAPIVQSIQKCSRRDSTLRSLLFNSSPLPRTCWSTLH